MLVMATFFSVSAVAVVVMVRFCFALESDIRSVAKRPAMTQVFLRRHVHRPEAASRAASALLLVYSNPAHSKPLMLHRVHCAVAPYKAVKGA